ncbi:PRC-barrel domain-containing protein [Caloramator sp. mosi_1]|uniref:PRC-barrel domain-containing protein n=1 Tax=Caloramator sp. mosi_1 TaxID=3023090 RepID=UPI0023628436|nr:PRC-barrel domain-containing protein [Caloramator sp. mosi_1]WDC83763.1 PRC-barrel domain-containing protein [Caloramator sp. mosi_1]
MKKLTDILNKRVVSYSGDYIGKVIDVLFDFKKLHVTGYIISKRRGILNRFYLITPKQINIVSEVIIISNLDKALSRIKYNLLKKLA